MPRSASGTKKKTELSTTPRSRAALSPLSRDAVVQAAIALADRDGLDAVSLRNVASALDAGPMRLYGHVQSKDVLLDLMVDSVYGELEHPRAGDRHEALRLIAQSLRSAGAKHPWFIGLLGGRPNLGEHALSHLEACLAALSFTRIDDALAALHIVKSYAIGAIQSEATDLASGRSHEQWQNDSWAYVKEMLATGRYPMLERVVREASHPEDRFERGLERVLEGIDTGTRKRR